jgi:hypothetical protein
MTQDPVPREARVLGLPTIASVSLEIALALAVGGQRNALHPTAGG